MSQRRQSVIFFSAVLLIVALITGLLRHYFHDSPPPGFADFYLVGVLVLAYRYSWKQAAALAGVSLLLGVYLLVPLDAAIALRWLRTPRARSSLFALRPRFIAATPDRQ